MRFLSLLAFGLLTTAAWGVDFAAALPPKCRQVVLVTGRGWAASTGTLQRYERSGPKAEWQPVGPAVEVLLGRHGLAWGVGVQVPSRIHEGGPEKVEGDGRAPAGIFTLGPVFGRIAPKDVGWLRMPYQPLTPATEAVDDPASRYYNRIVDRGQIAQPDWKSSEHMWRIAEYELGVVVGHNAERRRGVGSCIFLHRWEEGVKGTAGCTALHRADLLELLHWLDAEKQPLLVQTAGP